MTTANLWDNGVPVAYPVMLWSQTLGPAGSDSYTPPAGYALLLEHASFGFAGDSGGGWVELNHQAHRGAVTFFHSIPTGGNVQWDHWDGRIWVTDAETLSVTVQEGHFGCVATGLLVPCLDGYPAPF